MRIALAALAALVLAGAWYTAGVRAENAQLRSQLSQLEREATPLPVEPPAATAGAAGERPAPRMLSPESRDAMRDALVEAAGQRVWFVAQAGDGEADAFQRELEAVFLESGWEIAGTARAGFPLRAGLRMYIADEELPDHVGIALGSLRVAGLDVFAGSRYRAFYEESKEKNPDFRGFELDAEQPFLIAVGPNLTTP